MPTTSPLPDIDVPDTAITAHVLRRAGDVPDRPALIDGPSGRVVTFAELADLSARLAGGLAARGVGPGATVGLLAPNIPEYAAAFHGTAMAGGTVTTLNPTYTPGELRHQLQDSGASVLLAVAPVLDAAREAVQGTAVTEIVVLGDVPVGGDGDGAPAIVPFTSRLGEPIAQVPVDPAEQVVVLPYSSGTTGLPKGVMLTHRNLVANLVQTEAVLRFADDDVALAALPFFHIYGMQVLMNGVLSQGCTVVTMPRFDLAQALELIQRHRITAFFAVPPMVLALAKHPLVDRYDLSSLRLVFSGAAPLGADLAEEASRRIGCEVRQGYGMTELSPVSHASLTGRIVPGSAGVTVPSTECRIVDAMGGDQPAGEVGELLVRGPQVMKGYLANPEATAATIDAGGWLHTGDVGRFDDEGNLFIVDRVKELIKYKGFQVPPAELEALLVVHPAVADVAVVGIPDEEAGELPKAFVVRAPGGDVGADELMAYVKERVAGYKQLRFVEFVDEIPKSASGKILRRLLRDRAGGAPS